MPRSQGFTARRQHHGRALRADTGGPPLLQEGRAALVQELRQGYFFFSSTCTTTASLPLWPYCSSSSPPLVTVPII